jgi:hypothetical protein
MTALPSFRAQRITAADEHELPWKDAPIPPSNPRCLTAAGNAAPEERHRSGEPLRPDFLLHTAVPPM